MAAEWLMQRMDEIKRIEEEEDHLFWGDDPDDSEKRGFRTVKQEQMWKLLKIGESYKTVVGVIQNKNEGQELRSAILICIYKHLSTSLYLRLDVGGCGNCLFLISTPGRLCCVIWGIGAVNSHLNLRVLMSASSHKYLQKISATQV